MAPNDDLPLSFSPVQEQAAPPASLLESSWAGVLDFTQKQSTAKQPSVSAASTGMGSDWQVLKLTNDECGSSARSLPDSLASSAHDVAADCQDSSEGSCGSAVKNEAIADLLLQSADLGYSAAPPPGAEAELEAEEAAAAAPAAPPPGPGPDMDEYAGLLDLDSFEAVKAQRTVSSEGSVDGFSEASCPSSPRMRLLEAADQLEVEVEVEVSDDLSGVLPWLAEQLRSTCQQLRAWWEGQQQLLRKALRHGAVDATAALDALLPASLRQALLKLRMALNRHPSNWTVIALSVSVAGLAAMLVASHASNTKMARLLEQKDRELARLVVKIFTLQDTMQSAHHTPIVRHTYLPTTAMHPLF